MLYMEKHKKFMQSNKFKISSLTQNEEFELRDGSYSVSNIQNYFIYIIKERRPLTNNLAIGIYVIKIEKSNTLNINNKAMKLLGSTKTKIAKDKNGENVPHLELNDLVLFHFNVVNNDYQHNLRVLHTFATNKPFGQLLDISPKNFVFLKTFNSEFSYIEVWVTYQNSKTLEIK